MIKEASMAKYLMVLLALISPNLFAEPLYINEHEEGWYWHKDPKESPKKQTLKQAPNTNKVANPDKTWKLIGQKVQDARAQAILNPSAENIARARRIQRLVVAQANLFSEKWMLDLLLHPDQDESLVNPSSSGARDVYNQQNYFKKEKLIARLRQESGLIYFYQAGEDYSERMAQVVAEFANTYQITVIPIAMTDRFSPYFPNSQPDSGEANRMGVKHIPALFTLHPISKQPMPIAYGLVSQSELMENMLMAAKAFESGVTYEN